MGDCVDPSEIVGRHAVTLQTMIHVCDPIVSGTLPRFDTRVKSCIANRGCVQDDILREQRIMREYFPEFKTSRQEGHLHETVIKGFCLGMSSIMKSLGNRGMLIPELESSHRGAESVLWLIANKDVQDGASPRMMRCLGAQAAMGVTKDGDEDTCLELFGDGAEAATSLSCDGEGEGEGEGYRSDLQHFCQGASAIVDLFASDSVTKVG